MRFDEGRFPHALRVAVEEHGVLVEQLDPGLAVCPAEGGLHVTCRDGRRVGWVPFGRVAALEVDRLAAYLEAGDGPDAALAAIAVREDPDSVVDDPASEFVEVPVGAGRRYAVHRSKIVDDWDSPLPDVADGDYSGG